MVFVSTAAADDSNQSGSGTGVYLPIGLAPDLCVARASAARMLK